MRYQENRPVNAILAWLKEKGVELTRRSYQRFVTRVLHLMPLDQARELGANCDLLRAVRVRYKLAVDPKRRGRIAGKRAPRHDTRVRRRRILPERQPKRLAPPSAAHPARRGPVDADPRPLPGIVAVPAALADTPKLRGTPEKPVGFGDWKVINAMARAKLLTQTRHVYANMPGGRCFHLRSGHEYTEEELVREYGLSLTEAQSCFMTLDEH